MRIKKITAIIITTLILSFALINFAVYAEDISPFKSIKASKQAKNLKSDKNSKIKLEAQAEKEPKIKDRQVIIKFKDPTKAVLKNFKLSSIETSSPIETSSSMKKKGMLVARIPDGTNFDKALEELNNNNEIEYAEPNYGYKLSAIPTDPGYGSQWYLPKMSLPAVWDKYKGSSSIKVAVIDTGIDMTHPEFQGRLVPGYNFCNNNSNPADDHGHGTMVSGIIAANANNGQGIAGINWNSKIMPLKVADAKGYLWEDDIVNAIDYATSNGANIINMSFGSYYPSISIYNALYDAYKHDIVLVAASGNDSRFLCYPAAFPFVISVGATDNTDTVADFSNYGQGLDICAPGVSMYSTVPTNTYTSASGTSFASPAVAGVASLLLSKNPNLTPKEVAWILESSADMISAYGTDEWNYELGYGRINALSALNSPLPFYPNDTSERISSAKLIQLNQTYNDKFELPMDTDLYKFQVGTGYTSASIQISCPDSIDIYAELYKYNPAAGTLDYDNVQTIDDSLLGENENALVSVTPGTYYLSISDYYGHWSNDYYSVKVSTKALSSIKATPSSVIVCADSQEPVTIKAYYRDGSSEEISPAQIASQSSNIAVADTQGNYIYGISAGRATITFSFGGKTARVSATVKPELSNITFDRKVVDVEKGKTLSLKATARYIDGTTENISSIAQWGSGDESIATVARGRITGLNPGQTDIVLTFAGETVTITVNVIQQLTALSTSSSINMQQGDFLSPSVIASFIDSSTSDVSSRCTWTASGSALQVSSSGIISALSKGRGRVTAAYGSKKVNITVNVTAIVEMVTIKEPEIDVVAGQTKRVRVYAKYIGDDRLYDITRDVTAWYSYDNYTASAANGSITGNSAGSTRIYVYYAGFSDYVVVNVLNNITSLSIQVGSRTMTKGASQIITVIGRLSTGSYEDITDDCSFSRSNGRIEISYDNKGNMIVNALERGSAKITARYGTKRVTCTIKVIQAQLEN